MLVITNMCSLNTLYLGVFGIYESVSESRGRAASNLLVGPSVCSGKDVLNSI